MDGHSNISRLLVHHGANVNVLGTAHKITALGFAASQGRYEIAAFLLDNGATPYDSSNAFANSPIARALQRHDCAMLRLFLTHCHKRDLKLPLQLLFHQAIQECREKCAIIVLQQGYYPLKRSMNINFPCTSLFHRLAF